MNIEKSIENIVAKCDNYIDPQLAICIIRDNCKWVPTTLVN